MRLSPLMYNLLKPAYIAALTPSRSVLASVTRIDDVCPEKADPALSTLPVQSRSIYPPAADKLMSHLSKLILINLGGGGSHLTRWKYDHPADKCLCYCPDLVV